MVVKQRDIFSVNNNKLIKAAPYLLGTISTGIAYQLSRFIFHIDTPKMLTHPKDYQMCHFYATATILLTLLAFIGIWEIILSVAAGLNNERKLFLFDIIEPFMLIFSMYLVNFLIWYPGIWGDEPLVLLYALDYLPVYWHNYITSLYYMVTLTMLPISTAPILFSNLIWAGVYAWIYYKLSQLYPHRKVKYLVFFAAFFPYQFFALVNSYYTFVYASFHLFFFAYLLFEAKEQKELSVKKILILSVFISVLSIWRGAGIINLVMGPFLIYFTYKPSISKKKMFLFVLLSIIAFIIIKTPQKIGEDKFYHNDYKIINMTVPLSIILNREQTYKGAEEDIANIDRVIAVDYIRSFPESSASYQGWNNKIRNGRMTQTDATQEDQQKFLHSSLQLIIHNLDLFFKQRANSFFDACGVNKIFHFNYGVEFRYAATCSLDTFQNEINFSLGVIKSNQIVSPYVPGKIKKKAPRFFDKATIVYKLSILPTIIFMCFACIWSIYKKKWLFFTINATLIMRTAIIFLVSPAAFPSYYYAVFTGNFILIMVEIAEYYSNVNFREENSSC